MISVQPRIAVLVPCYNEEAAVATVVANFRSALPAAEIYVYDNNSRDRTAAVAREAGAIVRSERRQGKGHVVRRMFADVEADVYVLVDGDATYDAPSARAMIGKLVAERLDMVCAVRVDREEARVLARDADDVAAARRRDPVVRVRQAAGERLHLALALQFGHEREDVVESHRAILHLA